MRRLFLLFLLLILSSSVYGQDWARDRLSKSSRHSEWVTINHDNRKLSTLVAYPSSENKSPVVLIIHETYGMTDWAQLFADEIAADGYIAIAPDLLSGAGPSGGRTPSFASQDKAAEAIQHLNPDQLTADLRAAADYSLKLPSSNGQIFVVGFDWGADQAFRFATNREGIAATFVYYGRSPDQNDMMRITAPVYGFYAGVDDPVNSTLSDTKSAMKAAGKVFEPVTYDAAEHGFMRLGETPGGKPPNIIARQEAKERLEILIRRLSAKAK